MIGKIIGGFMSGLRPNAAQAEPKADPLSPSPVPLLIAAGLVFVGQLLLQRRLAAHQAALFDLDEQVDELVDRIGAARVAIDKAYTREQALPAKPDGVAVYPTKDDVNPLHTGDED